MYVCMYMYVSSVNVRNAVETLSPRPQKPKPGALNPEPDNPKGSAKGTSSPLVSQHRRCASDREIGCRKSSATTV